MAKSLLRMNNPRPEFIRLAVMMFLRLFRSSKNSDLPQRMSTMGSERALAAITKNVRYADKAAVHGYSRSNVKPNRAALSEWRQLCAA